MARKPVTKETYDKLEEAFLSKPNNIDHAAREAGVTWKTAERAWKHGWPRRSLPAIRVVYEEHQLKARALIEAERAAGKAMREKDRQEAHKNAIEARKQEGQMVQLSRAQSLQNLTVSMQLAQSARVLGQTLKELIEVQKTKIERWVQYEQAVLQGHTASPPEFARPALSLDQITGLLSRVASTNSQIVDTARQVMEMERLYLGAPTNTIELVDGNREISIEEMRIRMDAAIAAIDQAERESNGHAALPESSMIGKRVVVTSGTKVT